MLNLMKMDLYRMFHSLSTFYTIYFFYICCYLEFFSVVFYC